MTGQGVKNDKAKRKDVAAEQDGQSVGAGAIGIFGQLDCGKLGQSAKTIGFIAAGCDQLAGKPKAFL